MDSPWEDSGARGFRLLSLSTIGDGGALRGVTLISGAEEDTNPGLTSGRAPMARIRGDSRPNARRASVESDRREATAVRRHERASHFRSPATDAGAMRKEAEYATVALPGEKTHRKSMRGVRNA